MSKSKRGPYVLWTSDILWDNDIRVVCVPIDDDDWRYVYETSSIDSMGIQSWKSVSYSDVALMFEGGSQELLESLLDTLDRTVTNKLLDTLDRTVTNKK